MRPSRLAPRAAAIALLLGLLVLVGAAAASWIDSYADGQREIAEKKTQTHDLHEIARARLELAHLTAKTGKTMPLLGAGDDAQASLAAAVTRAADGQQVVIDGIEARPSADAALVTATVRLRGTQFGVYSLLRSIEEQVPYVVVPRLELSTTRAADPDRGKPLILSSELQIAALREPAPAGKEAPAPSPSDPTP